MRVYDTKRTRSTCQRSLLGNARDARTCRTEEMSPCALQNFLRFNYMFKRGVTLRNWIRRCKAVATQWVRHALRPCARVHHHALRGTASSVMQHPCEETQDNDASSATQRLLTRRMTHSVRRNVRGRSPTQRVTHPASPGPRGRSWLIPSLNRHVTMRARRSTTSHCSRHCAATLLIIGEFISSAKRQRNRGHEQKSAGDV